MKFWRIDEKSGKPVREVFTSLLTAPGIHALYYNGEITCLHNKNASLIPYPYGDKHAFLTKRRGTINMYKIVYDTRKEAIIDHLRRKVLLTK